jgi:exodeoxyribonuclease-5
MTTPTWSPKQAAALDAIARWLADPNGKPTFYLDGPAGSGKSTLLKHAVQDLAPSQVVYCAPTGKAALVMQRKGCPEATTIHSAIYRPAGDPPSPEAIEKMRVELKRLQAAKDAKAQAIALQLARAEEDGARKGPRFSLNTDAALKYAKLGVIDECSMIDRRLGEDLESFGTKLLVIGDSNQLPPVYGTGYFTSREPDARLEEIHRQALGSPILYLADLARRGERLPYGPHGDACEVLRHGDPSLEERAMSAEMILVGRNRTRHACNAKIRRLLGRDHEAAPVAGDRAICLRNNHDIGILNGSTWIIDRCVPDLDKMTALLEMTSADDEAERVTCHAWLHHFMAREDELKGFKQREYNEVGYGWAITTHKSQGSQFRDVLLFDESRQFGADARKHLYTGITRASHKLTVVQ